MFPLHLLGIVCRHRSSLCSAF